MHSIVWFRRKLTNIDSREIIFCKRAEYTLREKQERKFPPSNLLCQPREKKMRQQIVSATKELMKYFHNILKATLGYKKCQQPVTN